MDVIMIQYATILHQVGVIISNESCNYAIMLLRCNHYEIVVYFVA